MMTTTEDVLAQLSRVDDDFHFFGLGEHHDLFLRLTDGRFAVSVYSHRSGMETRHGSSCSFRQAIKLAATVADEVYADRIAEAA